MMELMISKVKGKSDLENFSNLQLICIIPIHIKIGGFVKSSFAPSNQRIL